jgi:hypothetical protein
VVVSFPRDREPLSGTQPSERLWFSGQPKRLLPRPLEDQESGKLSQEGFASLDSKKVETVHQRWQPVLDILLFSSPNSIGIATRHTRK